MSLRCVGHDTCRLRIVPTLNWGTCHNPASVSVAVNPTPVYVTLRHAAPLATEKRNRRERCRVRTINAQFDLLNGLLRPPGARQRWDKQTILLMACDYIRRLRRTLREQDANISLQTEGTPRCDDGRPAQRRQHVWPRRTVRDDDHRNCWHVHFPSCSAAGLSHGRPPGDCPITSRGMSAVAADDRGSTVLNRATVATQRNTGDETNTSPSGQRVGQTARRI